MTATNPVVTTLVYNGADFDVKPVDEIEVLKRANDKSFCAYQWGCWVTAWSRYWLQRAIDLCGTEHFIYCDTDSVKFVGDVDFTELNNEIRSRSEKNGAYAIDANGEKQYTGVYLCDAEYKRFCSLGAKKYVYEDMKGKLHITIAGVAKESGAEELGCIENFKADFEHPFVFHKSAGMEAYYNDVAAPAIEVDGHTLELPPNIYLKQGEYTLGVTLEYQTLFRLTQEDYDKIMKTL